MDPNVCVDVLVASRSDVGWSRFFIIIDDRDHVVRTASEQHGDPELYGRALDHVNNNQVII